jgi:hypothetical protein
MKFVLKAMTLSARPTKR